MKKLSIALMVLASSFANAAEFSDRSRVGKGNGKVAAGAVGAAVGAVVGDRMQNDDTTADTRNVERCTQRDNYQRVQEGYTTVFSYNGHEFEEETQTKYRVGQKEPVQVNAVIDQLN